VTIRKGLPAKLALTDADDTRYLFSGLVVCNVDGSPRGGVLSPVGVNLVTSSATMNVSVARFQGAAVRDGGIILLANDGAANVLLDAAPGANSRIDVIYSKQNDASGTVTVPDANNTALLTFVKGTAGAVPVKPTLPVGALELATVLIPSGATATNSAGVVITQTAQFTAAAGGMVPFSTKTALDLWTTAPSYQRALNLATGAEYRQEGGVWVSALRSKTLYISVGTTVSGTSLGTLAVPRKSGAQRVIIDIAGMIAPVSGLGNVAISVAASTGGTAVANPSGTVTVASGYLGQYARKSIFDISAGAGADVTFTFTLSVSGGTTNAQVAAVASAEIYQAGQY
jgi:hypothetical protein